MSNRNRFDLRFVDEVFNPRHRNRSRIERAFKPGRFESTLMERPRLYMTAATAPNIGCQSFVSLA
jgi:hypothetical protein